MLGLIIMMRYQEDFTEYWSDNELLGDYFFVQSGVTDLSNFVLVNPLDVFDHTVSKKTETSKSL